MVPVTLVCPTCEARFDAGLAACPEDGAVLIAAFDPADPDPRVGSELGGYVVVRSVAAGAMGRVYEGRDPNTLERVAIKVLHPDICADPVSVERFRREHETLLRLRHPNVLRALNRGKTSDGLHFMVMEHLAGEELASVLSREGAIHPARTIRVVCQIALALEHAHEAGVVHRDLKPENIFLCPASGEEHVTVLDFGVVKLKDGSGPQLTAFGTALGSPCYMSPEQAMGKADVDHRTDVFALAAIMHELAAGEIAFDGTSVAEIMMRIVRFHPPLAHERNGLYPPAYGEAVDRGLRKDRRERPASMLELAGDMLVAFGLEPEVAAWASVPVAQIAEVLADLSEPRVPSEPPEPRALSVPPGPRVLPVSPEPRVLSVTHGPRRLSEPPGPRVVSASPLAPTSRPPPMPSPNGPPDARAADPASVAGAGAAHVSMGGAVNRDAMARKAWSGAVLVALCAAGLAAAVWAILQ